MELTKLKRDEAQPRYVEAMCSRQQAQPPTKLNSTFIIGHEK